METRERILIKSQKSFMAAILLSVLLGPIGLLYAGLWSGVIMTILMIISVFIPKIGYVLFVLLWFIGPYWAIYVCTEDNKNNK